MTRPVRPLLVLLATLLLAGCGDSDAERRSDEPSTRATTERQEATAEPEPEPEPEEPAISIEPGIGITGVKVGDRRAAVVAALGEPASTREQPNTFSGGTDERLAWDDPIVAVLVQDRRYSDSAIQIEVTDPNIVTSTGDVAVGSTLLEVKRAFPKVRCDAGGGELVLCRLGREQAGAVVTDFFLERDAVTRIVIGRIID